MGSSLFRNVCFASLKNACTLIPRKHFHLDHARSCSLRNKTARNVREIPVPLPLSLSLRRLPLEPNNIRDFSLLSLSLFLPSISAVTSANAIESCEQHKKKKNVIRSVAMRLAPTNTIVVRRQGRRSAFVLPRFYRKLTGRGRAVGLSQPSFHDENVRPRTLSASI